MTFYSILALTNIFFTGHSAQQILSGDLDDLKLLMKSFKTRQLPESGCCICGLVSCKQSTDHEFVSLKDFKVLLNGARSSHPKVDEIKQTMRKFYKSVKDQLLAVLQEDQNRIQEHLNKFYFANINPQKINISELSCFLNSKFNGLPSKKMVKVIQVLKQKKDDYDPLESSISFQELSQQISGYMSEFQKRKQLNKLKSHLPYASILQKSLPKLKLRRSQSQISNPEQVDEEAAKMYTWKNVTLRNKTKVLQLSNKNITDNELLREMPVLSSFKNVKDFQIRHNNITRFSCKIIASNLSHVKSVDIRGNAVGDEGVISIATGLPHLKSFMISETRCTNLSANVIATVMKDLEVLWCEQNSVDGEHSIKLGQMPKLKVLSFAGNGLDAETGDRLKKIFNCKGYVIV